MSVFSQIAKGVASAWNEQEDGKIKDRRERDAYRAKLADNLDITMKLKDAESRTKQRELDDMIANLGPNADPNLVSALKATRGDTEKATKLLQEQRYNNAFNQLSPEKQNEAALYGNSYGTVVAAQNRANQPRTRLVEDAEGNLTEIPIGSLVGTTDGTFRRPGSKDKNEGDDIKTELSLRRMFVNDTKELGKARTAYNTFMAVTGDPNTATAPENVAAIVKFLKVIDPPSVARESEQAGVKNAKGLADTVMNYQNQLLNGNTLTPKQIEEMRSAIEKIYKPIKNRHDAIVDKYRTKAERAGLDADFIVDTIKNDETDTEDTTDTDSETSSKDIVGAPATDFSKEQGWTDTKPKPRKKGDKLEDDEGNIWVSEDGKTWKKVGEP